MSRVVLALVLTAALAGAWFTAPGDPPVTDPVPLEPAAASAVVCPVQVDRTTEGKLTVGATVIVPARLTIGSAGTVVTDVEIEVGEAGGGSILFDELGVGGGSGAFIELGDDAAAAAAVSRGAGVTATECASLNRSSSLLVGASTGNAESLDLVLVNPYGSDAVVNVQSSSEAGVDSADELAAVTVPARSTVIRDVATLLPLRTRLSVEVGPTRGLVHAFLVGGGGGDRVVIGPSAPDGDWVVPVPRFAGETATLVIATISPVDVAVRVDGWADGLFVEEVFSGAIPARSQVEVPLTEEEALDMVEVLADGPVAVSVVVEGEAGRAVTAANDEALPEWLMPGPGSDGSVAWIGVPGDADGVVELQSLTPGGESFVVDVPAGRLTPVTLRGEPTGYFLRADIPVSVVWSVSDDTGIGLGTPTPVRSGV